VNSGNQHAVGDAGAERKAQVVARDDHWSVSVAADDHDFTADSETEV
jgi:hypothetical protein